MVLNSHFFPVGLRGLVLAAMLAAAMVMLPVWLVLGAWLWRGRKQVA